MLRLETIKIDGVTYRLVPEGEPVRRSTDSHWPRLPRADRRGNVPAVAYALASMARKIIRRRRSLGLSQADLAKAARVPLAKMSSIETGKHDASTPTIDRISKTLDRLERKR